MLETPSRKKKQVSKQSNQEVNQVQTNISGRSGFHNNSNCASKLVENQVPTSIFGRYVYYVCSIEQYLKSCLQ